MDVVDAMHRLGKRCIGWGWQDITTADVDPETSQGDAYQTFGWATQLAEVEVDTETGFVRVVRLASATDAGKAINPVGVEGQIQGGAVMGLGYGLYEQHILEDGHPQTASLAFYLVPTTMDVPEIECLIVEVPEPTGPYGAKGVSEPATIPTAPAILNAIYDAVGDPGDRDSSDAREDSQPAPGTGTADGTILTAQEQVRGAFV